MTAQRTLAESGINFRSVIGLLIAVVPMAAAVGSAVAFFLWALDGVTQLRFTHAWLLWLLPAGGALIGFVYHKWGHASDAGTRLIIDEIHEPGGGIPARMAPLVLLATLITHLFGGSAGREGTAVQMGGSLASAFERKFLRRLLPTRFVFKPEARRQLLQAGMAAGFGAVFGTPLAGAVFALEVLRSRKTGLRALFPCLLAAYVGHWTVAALGVMHTTYPQIVLESLAISHVDVMTTLKVAGAAACFGFVALLFLECAHAVGALSKHFIPVSWLRPVAGGIAVVALTMLVGSRDYLGLGVVAPGDGVSITSSFTDGGATQLSWLYKLVFTSITVGSGFKGGEVTPLFFIGSTLGHTLGTLLHAPIVLFAALGFVAVFGAAAKTPVACTIMAAELFGPDALIYFALACGMAFLCSGRRSLYSAAGALRSAASPEEGGKQKSPHKP